MSKIILGVLFLLLALFVSPSNLYAADQVYPDTPGISYKLMRVKEKFSLLIKFNAASREKYYEEILDRRLNELDHIVMGDKLFYLETTSQRYAATAGELSELIVKNKLKDSVPGVKSKFENHTKKLIELRDRFGGSDRSEWRLIQYSVDSLKTYSENISSI